MSDSSNRKVGLYVGIGLIVIALLAGGYYLLNKDTNSDDSMVMATPTPTAQPTSTPEAAGPSVTPTSSTPTPTAAVKTFNISAKNYSFSPNSVTVNQGDTVKIILKNTGGTHDLVIDEFNVDTGLLEDGESKTVQFVANKKGSFEFYCSFSDHRAMGMVGTIKVN